MPYRTEVLSFAAHLERSVTPRAAAGQMLVLGGTERCTDKMNLVWDLADNYVEYLSP